MKLNFKTGKRLKHKTVRNPIKNQNKRSFNCQTDINFLTDFWLTSKDVEKHFYFTNNFKWFKANGILNKKA